MPDYKVITLTDPRQIAEQLSKWLDAPEPEFAGDPFDIDPYDEAVDKKLMGD